MDKGPAASEGVAGAVVVRNVAGEGEVPPGTVQVEAVVRDETVAAERWSRWCPLVDSVDAVTSLSGWSCPLGVPAVTYAGDGR